MTASPVRPPRRDEPAWRNTLPNPSVWLSEVGSRLASRHPPATIRPPRTTVDTVAAVPGWALRLLLAVPVGLAGVAVASGEPQWAVTGALAVLVVTRPHGALTALAVAVLAGMLALLDGPAWWQLPVLLLASHALLVHAALADITSWRGRVEVAVLRDAVPAFLGVQVVAQAAGVTVALLRGAAPVPWLVVVALGGLGVVSWLLTSALTRRRLPASHAAALEARRRRTPPF